MKQLSSDDPRSVGHYHLLAALGEGGMGRVYLARSARGRMVAVKVVRSELARQSDFRRRFAREIRAAQRVDTSHRDGVASIPQWTAPVLDFDTEAELPWFATGYIAGPSLSDVVDEQYGPLPEQTVTALAWGLSSALRAIHGAGLVHRDLKPSNVLITIDGPRVIDFGIARALDGVLQSAVGGITHTGSMVGSPGFMSPEQVRGRPATPASDIFCLGTVLFYAATGRMPFGSAETGVHAVLFRIAEEEPDLTGLSGSLLETVHACLTKDPQGRPTLDDLAIRSERQSGAPWLPAEVLAQLGRHAVRLLDFEEPLTDETRQLRRPPGSAPSKEPQTEHTAWRRQNSQGAPHHGSPAVLRPTATGSPHGELGIHSGVPGLGTPPNVSSLVAPSGYSPRRSGRVLAMALAMIVTWCTIRLVFSSGVLSALVAVPDHLASETHVKDLAGFGNMRDTALLLNISGIPLLGGAVGLWSVWYGRIRANAEHFARGRRVRYSPEMAVAAFFIPLCSLFVPKQIMNDVWTVSHPLRPQSRHRRVEEPRRALVHAWWWLWLGYFFSVCLGSLQPWWTEHSISGATQAVVLAQLTDTLGIASASVALLLVMRLTSLQEDCLTGMRAR